MEAEGIYIHYLIFIMIIYPHPIFACHIYIFTHVHIPNSIPIFVAEKSSVNSTSPWHRRCRQRFDDHRQVFSGLASPSWAILKSQFPWDINKLWIWKIYDINNYRIYGYHKHRYLISHRYHIFISKLYEIMRYDIYG